jgi:hypothetical protein
MKTILSIALIALVMSGTMQPPEGNCKTDEDWVCSLAYCSTTLLACPTVFRNGQYVDTNCHNQTTCNWDCSCVKKQPKEEE